MRDPPEATLCVQAISALISAWPKGSTSLRHTSLNTVCTRLRACASSPVAHANLTVLTLHTCSHLLSRDAAILAPSPLWTTHPRFSEPLILAFLQVIHDILSDHVDDREPLRMAFLAAPPRPHHYSLAFLIGQLTLLSDVEPAISVRQKALLVLEALVSFLDAPLLASYAPGLFSKLTSILARSPRLHSALALPAFQTLRLLLSNLFPSANAASSSTPHTISDALKSLSIVVQPSSSHEPTNPDDVHPPHVNPAHKRDSLRVQIDTKWITRTATELRPRLAQIVTSRTGPRFHTQASVQIAFVQFLSHQLLNPRLPPDDAHKSLVIHALLEACSNSFPHVSSLARDFIVQLGAPSFERAVGACLRFAKHLSSEESLSPGMKIDLDAIRVLEASSDDEFLQRLCSGVLVVLSPIPSRSDLKPSNEASELVIPKRRLPAFITRLGPISFANMLVSLHTDHWCPTRVARDAVVDAMQNRVITTAVQLGSMGLMPSVYSSLQSLSTIPDNLEEEKAPDGGDENRSASKTNEFQRKLSVVKKHGHAALVLYAFVKGAMESEAVSEVDAQHVHECVKETLETLTQFFVPSMEQATEEDMKSIDDEVISLKMALLCGTGALAESLEQFHRRCEMRPLGSDVVLCCIMHLLRDVSHGEGTLRHIAEDVLSSLAKSVRCCSVRALLLRHLNFILGRVIRNLNEVWAGDVLRYLMGGEADDVSREATVMLLQTIQGLSDGLAGASDERALQTLASIRSVLVTAVAQQENFARDNVNPTSRDEAALNVDLELGAVLRVVLGYCFDEVDAEDEKLARESDVGDNISDGFEEEGLEKSAFDELAERSLEGACDLLVGRGWRVRAAALESIALGVRVLKRRKRLLLPHIAKILPLLPSQFATMDEDLSARDSLIREMRRRRAGRRGENERISDMVEMVNSKGAELPVVRQACVVLKAIAECGGSFMRERFVRMVYPRMRVLVELCGWFPSLVSGHGVRYEGDLPSYGAMAACDACLEAVAAIAECVPSGVAPFAKGLVESMGVFLKGGWKGGKRGGNESMVRFERERWERRVELGKGIVKALRGVRGDEVFVSWICGDENGPDVLRGDADKGLRDVVVR